MGARVVIVIDVRDQDPAQMPLVNHDHMVKTLAANRADDALDVGILPGRSYRLGRVGAARGDFPFPLFSYAVHPRARTDHQL